MKLAWTLLLANLILFGVMATGAYACGAACGCCGRTTQPAMSTDLQVIVINVDVKDLPHQAVKLGAQSLVHAVKFASHMPGHIRQQMRTGSDKAQVAFHAATGQTQSTFQRITAGVTSLSLQLIRGVCSYFWALISGLLR